MDLNIFLPDDLSVNDYSHMSGYAIKISDKLWGIFVIKTCNEKNISLEEIHSRLGDSNVTKNDVSYCDVILDKTEDVQTIRADNYLRVNIKNGKLSIKNLVISKNTMNIDNDIRKTIFLLYNRSEFLTTEVLFSNFKREQNLDEDSNYDTNQFYILKNLLSKETHTKKEHSKTRNVQNNNFGLLVLYSLLELITEYSRLFLHVSNISKFISQILFSIWKKRKVSVKIGNFITALLLDLTFGIIILYWINIKFPNLENDFFEIIEDIISYLKALLSWLMGSPAGLKLNRTFNNLLGNFFLKNIDLWWKFLEISRDVLEFSLQIFKYLGIFGITFQAAILADLLAFASLHIYCIYIYAARLYNVQISALKALLRLFLGKKYNPLRNCVDTCHYNYHQLFIGTLGFTIMLFLLPTTLMYYFVFTVFRVLIILLMEILSRIQITILSLPLFSLILWLFKSSKIAGNLHVEIQPDMSAQSNIVVLLVKLKIIPVSQIIEKYSSTHIQLPKSVEWVKVVSKICNGNLLYSV